MRILKKKRKMKHFLKITRNQVKNKANEELQNWVLTWNHALVDDANLTNLLDGMRDTIKIINSKYLRCQDITLMTQFYPHDPCGIIWVEGNFQISVMKVQLELL